jgi:hypothetical protein
MIECFRTMKIPVLAVLCLLGMAGCASAPAGGTAPTEGATAARAPAPQNINWEEVDRSTARAKERKAANAWTKTETKEVERGYFPMTEEEYATALASATEEVRKANPQFSNAEVKTKARERADEAKRQHENSYQTRASAGVKWTSPP